MAPNLIDEVNRLFDELVHDPWRGSRRLSQRQIPLAPTSDWAVEIPLRGLDCGHVSVTTEGRRLNVTVSRRASGRGERRGESGSVQAEEHFRQSFLLPEGTMMTAVEATFEDDLLRIRVGLRRH